MSYSEVLYIINSSLDPKAIETVKKEVEEFITSEGGDIYNRADWGRTRLAYEIDKQRYGNYILVQFGSKPSFIKVLKEKLELMDAVLSQIVIALDSEPERIEEEVKNTESEEVPAEKTQ